MSHRARVSETYGQDSVTSNHMVPQSVLVPRVPADRTTSSSQRYSMTSVSSSGRQSTSSFDDSNRSTQGRPSGIPRPVSGTSQTRLSIIASARPAPLFASKTSIPRQIPPVGTMNKEQIQSAMAKSRSQKHQQQQRQITMDNVQSVRKTPVSTMDKDKDSVLGVAFPVQNRNLPSANLPPRLIPELQALAASSHRPHATNGSVSTVSSPSTIFTGSPSPWSASTATTTPISWSSASPSIAHVSYSPIGIKKSQTVPIPAVSRTKLPKLPVVRESAPTLTSSSHNNLRTEALTPPRKLRRQKSINSPAPTPPPRSSSIQRTRSRSSSKSEEHPRILLEDSPPPLPSEPYLEEVLSHPQSDSPTKSSLAVKSSDLSNHHHILQDALNSMVIQSDFGSEEKQPIITTKPANFDVPPQIHQSKRLLDPAPIVTSPPTPSSARSRLAKFSKMALFGRSNKGVEPFTTSDAQTSRLQRKGPAAGTGHEGYSKYAKRGRKYSTEGSSAGTDSETSVVSTSRKPMRSTSRRDSSVASQKSQSDLDEFTSSRLKPVIILGGSQKSASHYRDSYSQVMTTAAQDLAKTERINPSNGLRIRPDANVLSSAALLEHDNIMQERLSPGRQSRLQRSPDKSISKQITSAGPIHTPEIPIQPYLNNWNTSESSMAPSSVAVTDIGSNLSRAESNGIDKQFKRGRKLRWNIFRKRGSETEDDILETLPSKPIIDPGMAVSVSTLPAQRPVPFYAMLESESENNTAEALGEYLNEAAIVSESEDGDSEPSVIVDETPIEYRQKHESILLPSAPQYKRTIEPSRAAAPHILNMPVSTNTAKIGQGSQARRPPRLAQVGRIPKVISTTQMRQPSRMSFSRPFQSSTTAEVERPKFEFSRDGRSASRPTLEVHTDLLPSRPVFDNYNGQPSSALLHPNLGYARDAAQNHVHEALKISDRQSVTSSSSDGMISVIGPPLLPVSDTVRQSTRRRTLAEEDIWNEYDDLIDHVTSPPRLKKSSTRSIKVINQKEIQRPETIEIIGYNVPDLPELAKGLAIDTSFGSTPMIYASPEVLQESEQIYEVRLRRSRIISALHSSLDPSSPFSIGDYLGEHGNPLRDSTGTSSRLSTFTAENNRPISPRGSGPPGNPPITSSAQHYENAMHIDDVQRVRNPIRHSELSYTSLMVSRWLSFGRVLFSPAHADIQKQPERHILVIDGLGSDDWSIYCAVTYQAEQAYIYDLKETGGTQANPAQRRSENTPSNLRRREMASFYDPIKFPDNFFSAIILRFPPVMADSKLRNLISECRRVLAPGGFMELMLLDLDIVNMGVLTRRALRDLKTNIAMADPGASLKPVMDNFQSALGEKGFSKLSRCVVGVPVVGKPSGASESPVSSRSSGGSDQQRFGSSAGPRPFDGIYSQNNHNFSLNDLVADHSDNADAKISKMVSRTARNWWQHCFEAAVIPDGDLTRSIFADRRVLSECKARASSFKLLIAYTQKPAKPILDAKRRTMSEPLVATLATA